MTWDDYKQKLRRREAADDQMHLPGMTPPPPFERGPVDQADLKRQWQEAHQTDDWEPWVGGSAFWLPGRDTLAVRMKSLPVPFNGGLMPIGAQSGHFLYDASQAPEVARVIGRPLDNLPEYPHEELMNFSNPPQHPDPWMDSEPGSLTLPEHWGAMNPPDLNQADNMFGPLDGSIRARLMDAINNPSPETWQNARSIVIREPMTTLWKAVMAIDPQYADNSLVPPRDLIIQAIRYATG